MAQRYKVVVKAGTWDNVSWLDAVTKVKALLDLGAACGIEFGAIAPDQTPKPEIRTVEVKTRVYVCSGCMKEFPSVASLRGHINRGTHRVKLEV